MFQAVAFLDEMLAAPELLRDYARSFRGRPDAELVLLAPRFAGAEAELEAGLEPLAGELGLNASDGANVVVLTQVDAAEQLAAHVVYSRAEAPAPLAALPRATDAGALLAFAARGVLVVGMHRSGTSAVARLLDLLGVSAGAAGRADLDERLLEARAGNWCGVPEGTSWEGPDLDPVLADARAAAAAASGGGSWTWKDPRLCLTLPFWRRALPADPVVVLLYRNPLEVARSLERRNGIEPVLALALWERYVRTALAASTGLPVYVVDYAAVVEQPFGVATALRDFLRRQRVAVAGEVPVDLTAFVDAGLRHAEHSFDDFRLDPSASRAQVELLQALETLRGPHESFAPPLLPRETPTNETLLTMRRELDRLAAGAG
jgi:hypothetical protein